MASYTTIGKVRGSCGHKHRYLETAFHCVRKDREGCARQGGYSDREVRRVDGSPLGDNEACELNTIEGNWQDSVAMVLESKP